ncbi:glycoside hydrolase family 27 protein [Maribacter ulvicola]|uniref:Alpha-galactosidase n=1 Tax=Maribacter ulvicola TaxID=228959 RepID=A0A1N6NI53_9FLAO|nr:glycoside hydrolase family 27 protein [Maribacter ulvicola]SIP91723.1 Alpha galactosidase A [Maribacter ulvicola]
MNKLLTILLIVFLISCHTEKSKREITNAQNRTIKNSLDDTPKPPIMGWASWNNYRIHINEEIIKSQADAMLSTGLKEVGYTYINTDDGFFGGRDENGNILPHKERFPNGMKSLADYIHSKGLKAGIYSDAGINTCASYWDKDTIGSGMGLYGHENQDLKLFLKEWDYDFIKIDWCGGEWLGLDEQTQYTEISRQIREIKPSAIFNVCRWKFPGKWVTQVADSWRISGDISNDFNSILHIIDLNADLWKYASKGNYNDMDMLQVGRGMSYEEDKTHFSMWSMMHSPLLLGNDLTNMSDETIDIITNKDIIALNQSSYVYQARRLIDYGDLEVWAKPLVSTMSGEIAVALLNRSEKTESITFNLKSVGLDASKEYTMKDLWTKESFTASTEEKVSKEVAPHGIVVLQIKGKSLPFNVFQYKDKD